MSENPNRPNDPRSKKQRKRDEQLIRRFDEAQSIPSLNIHMMELYSGINGIYIECICGWDKCLGYIVPLQEVLKAQEEHLKDIEGKGGG